MKSKPLVVAIAMLLVSGILLADASARKKSRSRRRGHSSSRSHRSSRSRNSAAAKAYARMRRAAAIRAAAVRAAQAEVRRAHNGLRSARTLLEREFTYSPKMIAAQANHKRADQALEVARRPVLERLSRDRDYKQALAEKEDLYRRAKALRREGGVANEQLRTVMRAAAVAGSVASKMKAAAINADPNASQALVRVRSAAGRVRQLELEFEGSLTRSPQWLSARKSLEQARIKLAQAYAAGNKALASAKRSLSRYSGRR